MQARQAVDIRGAVEAALEWLKSRHHPEKAHISLIGPPRGPVIRRLWDLDRVCRAGGGAGDDEEEEGAGAEEAEEAQKYRHPGWVFGAALKLDRQGPGGAEAAFRFYIRVGPDDVKSPREGSYVRVAARVAQAEGSGGVVSVELSREGGEPAKLERKLGDPGECRLVVAVVGDEETLGRLNTGYLKGLVVRQFSMPGEELEVEVLELELPRGALSAQFSYRGHQAVLRHAFAVVAGYCGGYYRAYLLNLGGLVEGSGANKAVQRFCTRPYSIYIEGGQGAARWAVGYFLEVEGSVELRGGWKSGVEWSGAGLVGAYPVNTLVIEEDGKILLRDYEVEEEVLYEIERGSRVRDFLGKVADEVLEAARGGCRDEGAFRGFLAALAGALEGKGIGELYTFQEEAALRILSSLGLARGDKHKAVVVMSRTAGGKTLAFLLPTLVYIAFEKACRGAGGGVKAILAYPTKALANDQLEEVAELLYEVEERSGGRPSVKVSFGVFHGNTKALSDLARSEEILPISCPLHGSQVVLKLKPADGGGAEVECLGQEGGGGRCGFANFLAAAMRKVRDEIYKEPPDILITDEDMINRVLSGAPYKGGPGYPPRWEWQLLGYPYKRCKQCGFTYPPYVRFKKCRECDVSGSLEDVKVSAPRILVLDEAHQLYGSFGIQVHHLLSLLEHVLGDKPLYVLSSATLARPEEFAKSLLGAQASEVAVVSAREGGQRAGGGHKRVFAFVMPKAYTRDATAVRALEKFIEEFKGAAGGPPKGIVFTNSLPESNELVLRLGDSQGIIGALGTNDRIGGHTTDYDRERAGIEIQFKKGEIDWLVATSTLEVGVDYGVVDAVAIYGMPYRVTSFVQRVGRAGRKKDAAIFVIFNPDNPVDYDFYESYKILSDGRLRGEAIGREVVEISPLNEEALRRAAMRWLIAEIRRACARGSPSVCEMLVEDPGSPDARARVWQAVIDHLSSQPPPMSLRAQLAPVRDIVDSQRKNLIGYIAGNKERLTGLEGLSGVFSWESLHSLRGADEEVEVVFRGSGSRRREMRVAVKKALRGTVIAYKGQFYMVDSVQQRLSLPISDWLR